MGEEINVELMSHPILSVDGRAVDPGPPLQRCVLALLARNAPMVVTIDFMVDSLWAEYPPASVGKSIQKYIWGLRRVLGPEAIETVPGGYRLTIDPDRIDVQRLRREAKAAGAEIDPIERANRLERVLQTYRGEVLAGIDIPFVHGLRVCLDEVRSSAFGLWCRTALEIGRHDEVIQALVPIVGLDQREDHWVILVEALHLAGRRLEAIETCLDARQFLRHRGLEPSAELRRVEQLVFDDQSGPQSARRTANE